MSAFKAALIILLVATAVVVDVTEAGRVGPCDQVCSRITPERHECCRAHGYSGYRSCSGGAMYCR